VKIDMGLFKKLFVTDTAKLEEECNELIAQLQCIFYEEESKSGMNIGFADILLEKIKSLYTHGEYIKAHILASKTLVLIESNLNPDPKTAAYSLWAFTEIYIQLELRRQRRFPLEEIEPLYRLAITKLEATFGAVHRQVIPGLKVLALTYSEAALRRNMDKTLFQKALISLEQALQIQEKLNDSDSDEILLDILESMRLIYIRLGDKEKESEISKKKELIRARIN
jgi:hypothetical protein